MIIYMTGALLLLAIVALVLSVLLDVAGDDSWPEWNDGQEFKAARDAMMSGR